MSATGKSALLDIVEYCLGRDHLTVPAGPIADSVQWYAVLLQLPTVRAFVARPRPRPGKASTSRAMLELGADMQSLPMAALTENTDTGSVREQLGRLLGIGENRHEPPTGSLRHPLAANLGHAALLCFQGQGEVANRALLFHRQGDEGMAQTLRDTLPYFLGAVAADQAVRRQQLIAARRDLRRAETDLANAERQADNVDAQLQALLDEAYSSGLISSRQARNREVAMRLLREAVEGPPTDDPLTDQGQAGRRRELEAERLRLRKELRAVADQRSLLVDEGGSEEGYVTAVEGQLTRLGAIDLLPGLHPDKQEAPDSTVCPVCGSGLDEPDPTPQQLGGALNDLRRQLAGVQPARPRREAALRDLDDRADAARQQLRALDAALAGLANADRLTAETGTQTEERAFRRGRIDAALGRLQLAGETRTRAHAVDLARQAVTELEELLDSDAEREELTSRLRVIGDDMTRWASERLDLEHTEQAIRLDVSKLTVVADTERGPVPLVRVGSAENWVGYHLVTHLALHRYFVRQNRPVPRFLMLDQPTQAYYQSDREQETGVLEAEADRVAVRRLFLLIREVIEELAPELQVIVCDHANLDEQWFQDAVQHNWRGGLKLIPEDWLNDTAASTR